MAGRRLMPTPSYHDLVIALIVVFTAISVLATIMLIRDERHRP